jgi:hypothetical protein
MSISLKYFTHAITLLFFRRQVYNSVCRDWDCVVEPFAANVVTESSLGIRSSHFYALAPASHERQTTSAVLRDQAPGEFTSISLQDTLKRFWRWREHSQR